MPYNFNFKFIKNEFYPNRRNGSATWVSPDNKYLYLFGGSENSNVYDDFLKYDINKNKWEIIENDLEEAKPESRFGSIHFVYKDIFYLLSGFGVDNKTLEDFWTYNLNTNQWTKYNDIDSNLVLGTYASYWLVNNKLYTIGGLSINNSELEINDKLMIYNLDNFELEIIDSSLIKSRFNANFWTVKNQDINYLYLLNGMNLDKDNEFVQIDDMWRFNTKDLTWENIDTIPDHFRPKNSCLKFQLNNKVYLLGGVNQNNEIYDQIWRFNPKNNNFKLIKNCNEPKARADSAIWHVNNKIFIYGGLGQKYHLNDFWTLEIKKNLF